VLRTLPIAVRACALVAAATGTGIEDRFPGKAMVFPTPWRMKEGAVRIRLRHSTQALARDVGIQELEGVRSTGDLAKRAAPFPTSLPQGVGMDSKGIPRGFMSG
jgi:hypothetical protein